MKSFKEMVQAKAKATAKKENEIKVEKMPKQSAPSKENVVSAKQFAGNKEVEKVLDLAFMLKSAKQKIMGESLNEKELGMFADAIQAKTATVITDIEDVIPSGFSGTFIQDMYAKTNLQGVIALENIRNFGMTDTIGDYAMEAFVVSELGTPNDTNDSMIDFEYRGGKLMAKSYISYEALQDATIDMLSNKRDGLVRAMAVAVEKAMLNGQAGDDGVAGADARTLFRGIRKYGLEKQTVDFGGTALTEADWRTKILEMQEAGDLYTSWEEVEAGNVVLVVPTKVYNKFIDFDTFVDASKSGQASTLATGRKVSSVFNIPIITNRYFPTAVNASGVVDAIPTNNTLQSMYLLNIKTLRAYAVEGSALMETDKDIETQKWIFTNSLRLGMGSIFDQTSANPTAIDTTKKNVVAGINILA